MRRSGIVVNAHQNGSILSTGLHDPVIKVDEDISLANQDGLHLAGQLALQALGGIESQILFPRPGMPGNGPRILASMPCIDDHRFESTWSGSMPPLIPLPTDRASATTPAAAREHKSHYQNQSHSCHHCPMATPPIHLLPIQKSNNTVKV